MGFEAQWDLYRTFEAVARLGTLTAAAKALGLSQSTVSRHLSRLEEEAGSPLLLRESPIQLTQRGQSLLAAVEPMVEAALSAASALSDTLELRGEITLTTVGEVLRWVLAPHFSQFFQAYPHLRLRVLSDNRLNSLAAGEADVAIRLSRPQRGELVARKLRTETFAYYAAASVILTPEMPWLGLTGSLAMIPEQRHAARVFASRGPRLLVEDVESLGLAVQAGLGVAILPLQLARRLDGLVEVQGAEIGALDLGPIPSRDFWLVVHQSKQRLPKVRVVMEWLEQALHDP